MVVIVLMPHVILTHLVDVMVPQELDQDLSRAPTTHDPIWILRISSPEEFSIRTGEPPGLWCRRYLVRPIVGEMNYVEMMPELLMAPEDSLARAAFRFPRTLNLTHKVLQQNEGILSLTVCWIF